MNDMAAALALASMQAQLAAMTERAEKAERERDETAAMTGEWEDRCRRVEEQANRQFREAKMLRKALAALIARLDAVHVDSRYQSVWTIAQIHAGPYLGPTYVAELDAARAIVTQDRKPSSPCSVCPRCGPRGTDDEDDGVCVTCGRDLYRPQGARP